MILVLNCGSQSIKWKIFNEKFQVVKECKKDVYDSSKFHEIIKSELSGITENISAVGHRVVHGGSQFKQPTVMTPQNTTDLEKINHLAPLHNPYAVEGIKAGLEVFPEAKHTAVFDTEFYANLPEVAFTYALPEEISKDFGFKRYGFHGTSHEFVAREAAKKVGKPFNKLKIISCHLGGGASVTAIKNGKAVDTSMGFTPMEGVVMMTRTGNIDLGIVIELAKKYGPQEAMRILTKESGIKGLCGTMDMLEIIQKVKLGDKKTKLALDVFVYSIKKQIGAYYAILGGCDVLVFTGSIGSGNPKTRNAVVKGMDILSAQGGPASGRKKTKVLAIKTDEELAIAQKIKILQ